jgi:cation:H+ antiporter
VILTSLAIYVLSFFAIWFGAGLIIKSTERISNKLNLSSFAVSFFILGILTSIPEISIGFTAVSENKPEIFIGNLLGGIIVIYLLIIPLFAILGKGVKISSELSKRKMLLTLAVTAAPGLFVIDENITNSEGLMLVLLYLLLFYTIQKNHGILDKKDITTMELKVFSFLDLVKVMLGIGIVFVSSQYIVDQTIYFSQSLNVPVFFISLVLLSIGTNLPELSLSVRSILSGNKTVALGDYVGSAAANTLLFGIFTLLSSGKVIMINSFIVTFVFILSATGFFYIFYKSRREISVKEGWFLFILYLTFLISEIVSGRIIK